MSTVQNSMSWRGMVCDEVAVVELTLVLNDTPYTAKGWAKKHPKDFPDEHVGLTLAYARALAALANDVANAASMAIDFNTRHYMPTFTDPDRTFNWEVSGGTASSGTS